MPLNVGYGGVVSKVMNTVKYEQDKGMNKVKYAQNKDINRVGI